MWWVPLATAAVSAIMAQRQQKAQNEARKEQARYNAWAPLFGQAPTPLGAKQDLVTPAIFNGALTGYQMQAQYDENQRKAANDERLMRLMEGRSTANPMATSTQFASLYQPQMTYDSRQVDPETYHNLYTMS